MLTVALLAIGCAVAVWAYSRQANIDLANSEKLAKERLVAAQIASCERVNVLRRQFNLRGVAVRSFAQHMIVVNESQIESPDAHPIERYIARRSIIYYTNLASDFGLIPIVDCAKVVRGSTG